MHLDWGALYEGTKHKPYEREKGKFKQCKNIHTFQKTAFKVADALFAVKNFSYKKLQRQKVLCINLVDFSFKSGSKRPRFTDIKTGGYR
jgi:hypothetical protein